MNLGEYLDGANIVYCVEVVLNVGCDDHYPDTYSKTFKAANTERFVKATDITDIADYRASEILLMPVEATDVRQHAVRVYVDPWRHEGRNVLR